MEFTLSFIKLVFLLLQITAPIWALFIIVIVALGQIAGRLEGWHATASLYWSFVTATTVGYGDIRPAGRGACLIAVIIALCGLNLFGVLVAIAVQATTEAARMHADLSDIHAITN